MTASSPRTGRPNRHRRSRRRRRTAVVAAALTTGLGLGFGWLQTVSHAQQTPQAWTDGHHAVLRSGLTVDLTFAPAPGVTSGASTGTLGSAAPYADGVDATTAAEVLRIAEDHPPSDGTWHTLGTLRLTFSRPVRNPRLHLSGLAGSAGGTSSALRLTVTGGTPSAPTLTARSPWHGWTAAGSTFGPTGEQGTAESTAASPAGSPASTPAAGTAAGAPDGRLDPAGSLELDGTFTTATLCVERRDTAAPGSSAAPPVLRPAAAVTVDEALGSAPAGYGDASHVLSDLFLGSDAIGPAPRNGLANRSRHPQPAPAQRVADLRPGRAEHAANDPALAFPDSVQAGRYYDVTVPVSPGQSPATLAGWIDFRRKGSFDSDERAQVEVPPGAGSATLEWLVPPDASSGDTWARLRIARDPAQLVAPGGSADAGEVEDQAVHLSVSAAKPEIISPVADARTGDQKPDVKGDSGVPGSSVTVRDGTTPVCQAPVAEDGSWDCRPDAPLAPGAHRLAPAESGGTGTAETGPPVRLAVETAAPSAPTLNVPGYTNDPDQPMTGTGNPGAMIAVTDGGNGNEVCRTAVRPDRTWNCLPVEDFGEGPHQLAVTASDFAGHTTPGSTTTMIVKTTAPTKPLITAPAPGQELHEPRPQLAGRADAGTSVAVTDGGTGPLCSAVAAVDGSWSCRAQRDVGQGDQLLTATATDQAGNATVGDPVRVHLVPAPSTGGNPPGGAGGGSPTAVASPGAGNGSPSADSWATSGAGGGAATTSAGAQSPSAVLSPGAAGGPATATPSFVITLPVVGGSVSVSLTPSATASPSADASASPDAVPGGGTSPALSGARSGKVPGSAAEPPAAEPPAAPGAPAGSRPAAAQEPPVPPTPPASAGSPGSAGSVASIVPVQVPTAQPGAVAASPPRVTPSAASAAASAASSPSAVSVPSAVGSSSPGAVDQSAPVSSSGAVEPLAQSEALPPPADRWTGRHATLGGWRAAICGAFLILAGLTLITRRVASRTPWDRRG
ncbi:Ig-like domain-containing protein [Kitasatospora sp. RB6PN24]|uniref:Ig-like domain-containing protein n=1 Tax=Kitasatospora humi TaxID=2893891 RepID=UPI001E2A4E49|nr:Ig-like domain-containing protein [Kitasatospora humi]MCC9309431.1 Ig-like domain-containing protein [Kitasatospora humi]